MSLIMVSVYIDTFGPICRNIINNPLPPEIEKARRILEECMTVSIPGWEVVMTAEGDVGRTLKDI